MTPLRICMATTFYPPFNFGGDGLAVQRLARALVRRGHEVTVVHDTDAYSSLGGSATDTPAEQDGVTIARMRTSTAGLSALLVHQSGRRVFGRNRLERALEGPFDVIHFHNVSLLGGPGVFGCGHAAKLYTAHEHWLVCPTSVLWKYGREPCAQRDCVRCTLSQGRPPQLWRYTRLMEQRIAQVDAFIAMSEFSRRKHAEFGFTRDMHVIPAFLPDEPASRPGKSAPPHPRPYFLYVGRLERMKGMDDVIPLVGPDSSADLVIVGDGPHRAHLERLAAGNPCIRFLGRLPYEAIRSFYEHATALITPSLGFETFGMVVIEAFRHGTPVLARRVGPLPELIETSAGGMLFESQAQLAEAMALLVSRPELRATLGRAAADAFAAHWSEGAVMPRYLDLVERTLAVKSEQRQRGSQPVGPAAGERRAVQPSECARVLA